MWTQGHNNIRMGPNITEKMMALEGELSDEQAKATLAEFFFHNPAFLMDMIAGIKLFPIQEVVLKGWMKNDYNLAVWGRGVSKTLTYNQSSQLVSKEQGLISLPNLLPNVDFSKEGWVDIPLTQLWNGETWQETSKIYVQPQKNCLRIRTRDGFSLEGSTNHLIKIWNPITLEDEWKKYDQIKVGDWACISRNVIEWGPGASRTELDEAYLVGLLLGDGCYSKPEYGVRLTSLDEEILTFVERFPCGPRRSKAGTKTVDVPLKAVFHQPFMKRWGLKHLKSYFKIIPQSILKSRALSRECLRGLFDTDGTAIKTGGVSFSTTSETMAHQVQLLLLTFGIVASRKQVKIPSTFGKAFIVSVSGHDQDIFSREIGFGLSRKQAVLTRNAGKIRNTNTDIVPGAKEYAQKHIKSKHRLAGQTSKEWRDRIRRKNNQRHLSYDTIAGYVEFFKNNAIPHEDIQPLIDVLEKNFYFSPVTQIESFQHDCIDFNVPTGARYWANGFINHNSFLAAVFAITWGIYNPNNKIVIVSFAFRASRRILQNCETLVNKEGAMVLKSCFPDKMRQKTDEWIWTLPNGTTIQCLPLGDGKKIRGIRADTLIVDEFAYLPESIISEVIRPFLSANNKITEMLTVKEREDQWIKSGRMKEEDRTLFEDFKKVIFLSSACYQFEHMYKTYKNWIDLITAPEKMEEMKKSGVSYFVSRISYEACPAGLLNMKEIEQAQREASEMMFDREYRAIFTSDSGGYFSAQKMLQCSTPDKDEEGKSGPRLELIGERGAEYVLGIDPDVSGAEDADHFAMVVSKLVTRGDGRRIGMPVHYYAQAGCDMRDHMLYLLFLVTHFNIIYVGIDASQGDENEFINACNQSKLFKDKNVELIDIDAEFKKDAFTEVPAQVRRSYNKTMGKIVQKQPFGSTWQRTANEYLQASFDHKWIWFAGKIAANDAASSKAVGIDISMLTSATGHSDFKDMTINEFIANQDHLLDLTRNECAMIRPTITDLGTMSFKLPSSAKKTSGPRRIRRDSYSALLLCNWCVKTYIEAMSVEVQTGPQDFPYALIG